MQNETKAFIAKINRDRNK